MNGMPPWSIASSFLNTSMFKLTLVGLGATALSLTSPLKIHPFQQQAMQGEREGIKEKQTEALLAHSSIMAHFHFSPRS